MNDHESLHFLYHELPSTFIYICSIADTIIPTVEPQSPPSCIATTEEIKREATTPEMMTTIEITATREPSTVPPTMQGGTWHWIKHFVLHLCTHTHRANHIGHYMPSAGNERIDVYSRTGCGKGWAKDYHLKANLQINARQVLVTGF